MILNSAPQNEAVLSNVGATTEFRIKASAKAFGILSSGLYQNKVRAIIRELSCNAVDSHVAAGKSGTPFDIHLPNSLEPWFSIRDYGTGLSHEQVINIYTTYFESSKTDSNDYIGALGLGSKTPFSYTDNFTLTAIKDGRRGIYTAFITEHGLPGIALMMEEQTKDPSGVEVKFSVNDRYDFNKFIEEAGNVFTYFKLRPVVAGNKSFKFTDIKYTDKDIVPGVHVQERSGYHQKSMAIMGNIAYPIEVPESDTILGDYRKMLDCRLELHFAIGELDFQASREGLSYIPQTVEAIKRKLVALSAQLAVHLTKEADAIPNFWDRANLLVKKGGETLWSTAVVKYVVDTKFPLVVVLHGQPRHLEFKYSEDDLAKKFNLKVSGFQQRNGHRSSHNLRTSTAWLNPHTPAAKTINMWTIPAVPQVHFVLNDTKVGALQRAKFHWRESGKANNDSVYVLDAADKKKPVKSDKFLKELFSPKTVVKASTLKKAVRVVGNRVAANVTILRMETVSGRGRWSDEKQVWRDAGKVQAFDAKETHYYLPLCGFQAIGKDTRVIDVKTLHRMLGNCGIEALDVPIYGVRKGDLKEISTQKNWVNLETFISNTLKAVSTVEITRMAATAVLSDEFIKKIGGIYNNVKAGSLYKATVDKFSAIKPMECNQGSLDALCRAYAQGVSITPQTMAAQFKDEVQQMHRRYPLLNHLSVHRTSDYAHVAQYINLIDAELGKPVQETD